jgi:aminoglycoside phosphotransferase (APT) family kinase protein
MHHDPYASVVDRLFPGATLEAIVPLTGGVSADVRRLDVRMPDGTATRVVLRSHGATHGGHAAELEYRLLQALHRTGLPVAEPLLADVSGSLLPQPFVVMAFVEGTTEVSAAPEDPGIDRMADVLATIHSAPTTHLPPLPARTNPLPEVFDFLPDGADWEDLRSHLRSMADTEYTGAPTLLHGDFWPENLLWRNGHIAAILDWEDAALGDPLSDVACSRVELRYRFGSAGMERFTRAYARHRVVDKARLALWQVYVAAAAQRFMGDWRLPPSLEAHMRTEALASLREAGAVLMGKATR